MTGKRMTGKRWALVSLIGAGGCVSDAQLASRAELDSHVAAVVSQVKNTQQSKITFPSTQSPSTPRLAVTQTEASRTSATLFSAQAEREHTGLVQQVEYIPELKTSRQPASSESRRGPKTLTIDGQTYALTPVSDASPVVKSVAAQPAGFQVDSLSPSMFNGGLVESNTPLVIESPSDLPVIPSVTPIEGSFELPISPPIEEPVPLNLPSVLAAIDCGHPIVGQARWRVQQAYAANDQAQALWLPSIQAGFSFHRHDGNYQASDASIIDVNRNSFQYGLGAGATGAGTTNTRPGVIAQFHLADAIFLPRVTEKTAWAHGHAASATLNEQLLRAGTAYFDLVDAHQSLRIIEQARDRVSELEKITVDFAEAGEGLQSDADRMRTELALVNNRLIGAEEQIAVSAARLARAISFDGSGTIVPTDVNAMPLDLTSPGSVKASLVATALQTRPELKESQALVAAACEAYQREKYAPFVPSVLLGFSTGGFGGGLGSELDNVDSRYDFDALLSWEIRNLGLGEKAIRRERSARVQQAKYEKLRVMDQIALEVSETHAQVAFRHRQIDLALGAIQNAEDSYRRNLERIRDGEGLPLEVLQSAQALETAQRVYLRSVMDYNQAQMRLQWALGFPVTS